MRAVNLAQFGACDHRVAIASISRGGFADGCCRRKHLTKRLLCLDLFNFRLDPVRWNVQLPSTLIQDHSFVFSGSQHESTLSYVLLLTSFMTEPRTKRSKTTIGTSPFRFTACFFPSDTHLTLHHLRAVLQIDTLQNTISGQVITMSA